MFNKIQSTINNLQNRKFTVFVLMLSAYVLITLIIIVLTYISKGTIDLSGIGGMSISICTALMFLGAPFFTGNVLEHKFKNSNQEAQVTYTPDYPDNTSYSGLVTKDNGNPLMPNMTIKSGDMK